MSEDETLNTVENTDPEQALSFPSEMPPPLEPINPEETLMMDGPGQTSKHKMLCPFPGCGSQNNKMKRHVLRYHICHDRWWYLYPLLCCWTCKRWEIAIHVREHGPFQEDTHMGQLNNHVYEFLYFLTAALKLKSPQSLPLFVIKSRLGDGDSSFSEEEARVWDA